MLKSEMRSSVLIFTAVFCFYFAVNCWFDGPVYLTDEIGYLANAAFLTGGSLDAASSYHAGYSLLLIPAFLLFADPWWLWKAIVATNATLFGVTFVLAYNVCGTLFPSTSQTRRTGYTLMCALYPAYATGSGYALSQPGQLLVFMCAYWCLLRCNDRRSTGWSLAHSAACGFLFWLHPTGLPVVIASIVTLTLRGFKESAWATMAVGTTVAVSMIAIYQLLVGPYIIGAMTPDGHHPALHYPSFGATLSQFASITSVAEIFLRSLGAASYLTVASVGFAFWGAIHTSRSALTLSGMSSGDGYVSLFSLLSLGGTIAMGSALFAPGIWVSDTFFYGRYPEAVLLPLLLIGVLSRETDRRFLAATLVLSSTLLLMLNPEFMASPQDEWRGMNFLNATGLWPVVLPSTVPLAGMFTLGAFVVAVVGVLRRRLALACLLLAFSIGIVSAMQWHKRLYPDWGTPGSLPVVIRSMWPPKTCVGVDPAIPQGANRFDRLNLFKYYLHDFNYRRTWRGEWRTLCDGPILTYRPGEFVGNGAEVLAKEELSGLALVARKGSTRTVEYSDLYTQADGPCVTGWCFDRRAGELLSLVGERESGALRSNGRPGFLVYGPYIPLAAGDYTATIEVSAGIVPGGAVLDAVAGDVTLAKSAVGDLIGNAGKSTNMLLFPFRVGQPVEHFELRLFVTSDAKVAVYGYRITRVSP